MHGVFCIRLFGRMPRIIEKGDTMVDLFKDIPQEMIDQILRNIRDNLEMIDLYEGHTIKKHVDVQLGVLKTRLTISDIRYATSFYDFSIAKAAVIKLLRQNYEDRVASWLMSVENDILVLQKDLGMGLGYGYRKQDMTLYEGLSKIRLVLEKKAEKDWGFSIITCFPVF